MSMSRRPFLKSLLSLPLVQLVPALTIAESVASTLAAVSEPQPAPDLSVRTSNILSTLDDGTQLWCDALDKVSMEPIPIHYSPTFRQELISSKINLSIVDVVYKSKAGSFHCLRDWTCMLMDQVSSILTPNPTTSFRFAKLQYRDNSNTEVQTLGECIGMFPSSVEFDIFSDITAKVEMS